MDSMFEVRKRGSGRQHDELKYLFVNERGCGDDSQTSEHYRTYSISSEVGRSPTSSTFSTEIVRDGSCVTGNDSFLPKQNFTLELQPSDVPESSPSFSYLSMNRDFSTDSYSQQNSLLSPISFNHNQAHLNDRTRRYGHRFDTPILYQLQMDNELRHDLGFDYSRQVSAPNLSGEYEMEPPIHMPSGGHFDKNLLYPGYRYSTPLVYSTDRLGSPTSGPRGDDTPSQSSSTPPTSIMKTEGSELDNRRFEIPGLPTSFFSGNQLSANKSKTRMFLPPGENNPDATPGANLCYDFLNKGICERQKNGDVCHYRHLDPNHPDAIADRFKNNLLSSEEIAKYKLRKCEADEVNPFAPANAKICYDFLNKRVCSRTTEMKICRYRHLLPNHPDAKADRERTSKRKLISFGKV